VYPNATTTCSNDTWTFVCNAGFANADGDLANGCEADLMTDVNNCGAAGNRVTIPNGIGGCVNGQAVIVSCNPGWYDADGQVADGCESTTPPGGCPHANGLGGTYNDCGDPQGIPGTASTYTLAMAMLAAGSAGTTPSQVNCGGAGAVAASVGSHFAVWAYTGPAAGHVVESLSGALCPTTNDPTWN
jgi:hypothetical protein